MCIRLNKYIWNGGKRVKMPSILGHKSGFQQDIANLWVWSSNVCNNTMKYGYEVKNTPQPKHIDTEWNWLSQRECGQFNKITKQKWEKKKVKGKHFWTDIDWRRRNHSKIGTYVRFALQKPNELNWAAKAGRTRKQHAFNIDCARHIPITNYALNAKSQFITKEDEIEIEWEIDREKEHSERIGKRGDEDREHGMKAI